MNTMTDTDVLSALIEEIRSELLQPGVPVVIHSSNGYALRTYVGRVQGRMAYRAVYGDAVIPLRLNERMLTIGDYSIAAWETDTTIVSDLIGLKAIVQLTDGFYKILTFQEGMRIDNIKKFQVLEV